MSIDPITSEDIRYLEDTVKGGATAITQHTASLTVKLFKAIEGNPDLLPKGVKHEDLHELSAKIVNLSLKGLDWSYFRKFVSAIKNLLSGVEGVSSAHLLYDEVNKRKGLHKPLEQFAKEAKRIEEDSLALRERLCHRLESLKESREKVTNQESNNFGGEVNTLMRRGDALELKQKEFMKGLEKAVASDKKAGKVWPTDVTDPINTNSGSIANSMKVAQKVLGVNSLLVIYLDSPSMYESIEAIEKHIEKMRARMKK